MDDPVIWVRHRYWDGYQPVLRQRDPCPPKEGVWAYQEEYES